MKHTLRAVLAIGAVTAIAVLGFAGPASAHVTVNGDVTQGGYGRIAFRVPTESDTASTTKLVVQLPPDQPVASVSIQPVPGWTAVTTTTKLAKPLTNDDGDQVTEAVSVITWTADSADTAIKPGQFQEFPIELGPLPNTPTMTFKAVQTYSDNTVVSWIEVPAAGQAEPEHPAPQLKLAPAGDDSAAAAKSGSGSDPAALTIAIIAGVLALIGVALGGLAFSRGRTVPAA